MEETDLVRILQEMSNRNIASTLHPDISQPISWILENIVKDVKDGVDFDYGKVSFLLLS